MGKNIASAIWYFQPKCKLRGECETVLSASLFNST